MGRCRVTIRTWRAQPAELSKLHKMSLEDVERRHARAVRERNARRKHYQGLRVKLDAIEKSYDACSREEHQLALYLAERRRREVLPRSPISGPGRS